MAEIEQFITDLYRHYLLREPELGAVDVWTRQLRSSKSVPDVVTAFFLSDEFQGMHPALVAEVAALTAFVPPVSVPGPATSGAKWDTLGGTTSFTILRGVMPTLRLAVRNVGSEAWHQAQVVGVWDRAVSAPRPEAGLVEVVAPGEWANVELPIPVPAVADIYGLTDVEEIN